MKSILLLNVQHFKNRKRQYLLVGAALVLTSLILGVALSLLRIMDRPFDSTFDKLKASHILLLFDNRSEESDQIRKWFSNQAEVESVGSPSPYIMLNGPLIHGESEIDVMVQLTEHTNTHLSQDQVHILKGEQKEHPGPNEIWLPSHFETNHGLQVGDTLRLQVNGELHQMQISAFVVDPHYLSAIFNPTRAWLAPGSLPFLVPLSAMNNNMMGVRLRDKNQLNTLWERFNESFDYTGSSLQYPLFKRAFSSFYSMLGSVLLIFSLMALVISLLIINNTISSHIFSDYKQIGVLKSLGFTPRNIMALYVMQFSFLAVVSIPLGLLGASLVVDSLLAWIVNSIGINTFMYDLSGPFTLALGIMILSVLMVSLLSARKAGNIKAVEAIRNSTEGNSKKIKKEASLMESIWLPLSALLGFIFLKGNKRDLLLLGANMAGITFVIVFCVNISHSFNQLHANRAAWGFDKADIQLARTAPTVLPLEHEQLMDMLATQKTEIKNVTPFNYANLSILSENDKAVQEIFGKVYSVPISQSGLSNIEGKHPETAHEIALCIGTSKQFNKQLGDSISVFLEGQKKVFGITGIYQDVGSLGQGFRLHEKSILALNPLYEPSFYGLELQKQVDKASFRNRLQQQFGETIQTESSIEERKSMMGMIANIHIGVLVLSLFFVLVMVLLIHNELHIHIHQNKITFAKLKTIGFTSKQLRSILLWKVLLHLALSMLLGIPLSLLVGPVLMNVLTADIGLVQFPFSPFPLGILLGCLALFVLAALAAWTATSTLKKVNPRMLSNV